MGGHVFDKINLAVPRMPNHIYTHLIQICTSRLRALFGTVEMGAEAPEKRDHGDIDFFVHGALEPSLAEEKLILGTMKQALGAEYAVQTHLGQYSFAVAWPNDFQRIPLTDDHVAEEPKPKVPADLGTPKAALRFAQIDVEIIASLPELRWYLSTKSYGDLSHIMGVALRPYHLMFRPCGFFARMDELGLEGDKKKGLFLTDDVDSVLEFLRLEAKNWYAGFETEDEMFQWCTRGRCFDRSVFERLLSAPSQSQHEGNRVSDEQQTALPQTEADPDCKYHIKAQQRSRDRRYAKKRGMYMRFVNEWFPKHKESLPVVENEEEYGKALEAALKRWGKEDAARQIRAAALSRQKENELWERVAGEIARNVEVNDPKRVNLVLRGLKRWVHFTTITATPENTSASPEPDRPGSDVGAVGIAIRDAAEMDEARQPRWTESGVPAEQMLRWVGENHWAVRQLERGRVKAAKRAREDAREQPPDLLERQRLREKQRERGTLDVAGNDDRHRRD